MPQWINLLYVAILKYNYKVKDLYVLELKSGEIVLRGFNFKTFKTIALQKYLDNKR